MRLLFLFLPFGLGWLWLEYRLASFPNSYAEKEKHLSLQQAEIKTLILGSSQSYWALDPALLSGQAFNLANVSQSIDVDITLAHLWIPKLPMLKTIVLPISYFTLGTRLEDSNESWRLYFYHHFNNMTWHTLKPYTPRCWSKTMLYTVPEALAISFGKRPGLLPEANGWLEVKDTLHKVDGAEERVKFHTQIQQPKLELPLTQMLKKAVLNWEKAGIRTVLVTLPVTKAYAQFQNNGLVKRNQQAIEELKNLGAVYLDMNEAQTFEATDFADVDHLNAAGAAKASKVLEDLLKERKLQ